MKLQHYIKIHSPRFDGFFHIKIFQFVFKTAVHVTHQWDYASVFCRHLSMFTFIKKVKIKAGEDIHSMNTENLLSSVVESLGKVNKGFLAPKAVFFPARVYTVDLNLV